MKTVSAKTFANNVQKTLEKLRWTQTTLAQRTGIHAVTLSRILSGNAEPNLETIDRIAAAMGTSTPELLMPKGPRKVEPPKPPSFETAWAIVSDTFSAMENVLEALDRMDRRIQVLEEHFGDEMPD